jgi:hypothetical protein
MRTSNFALRLQPSLLEAARELAKLEGVALNQLINVAVAQMIASHPTFDYIAWRARGADIPRTLEILTKAGRGNPPMAGDELPENSRLRPRIEPLRQFVIEKTLRAYKGTQEGDALIEAPVSTGQIVFADPDYWKGVRWNGFEIVKLTLGPEWLCARREEFLRCARPVAVEEHQAEAVSA